jgi:Ras-related protein Rab-6A
LTIFIPVTARRQVTTETLETRAKELGVLYMETSAKAGHNVKNLFKKIALALPGANAEGAGEGTTTSEYHDGVRLPYTRRDGD